MGRTVEIPVVKVPMMSVRFLTDESGEFREKYNEFKLRFSGEAFKSLDIFTYDESGNVFGSNDFAPIGAMDCFPNGTSILSPAKFGEVCNIETMRTEDNPQDHFFFGTYQDPAIILRTRNDPIARNNYLSGNLFDKVKKNFGLVATPESPVMVPLKGLRLIANSKSGYGLVYGFKKELADDERPIHGKNVERAYGSNAEIGRFTLYDNDGVPIPDKNGKWRIYKRDAGASRVYSYCVQDASSDGDHLSSSNSDGRIVVGVVGNKDAEGVADYKAIKKALEAERELRAEECRDRAIRKAELEKLVAKL